MYILYVNNNKKKTRDEECAMSGELLFSYTWRQMNFLKFIRIILSDNFFSFLKISNNQNAAESIMNLH